MRVNPGCESRVGDVFPDVCNSTPLLQNPLAHHLAVHARVAHVKGAPRLGKDVESVMKKAQLQAELVLLRAVVVQEELHRHSRIRGDLRHGSTLL